MTTMKADVKAKWLEALRSGKYAQGVGHLNYDQRFCCLGVLCDIAAKEGVGQWRGDGDEDAGMFFRDIDGGYVCSSFLTNGVAKWSGLADRNPSAATLGPRRLSDLNDDGLSFEKIAAIIEKHIEGV